jgi:hypothetical protein
MSHSLASLPDTGHAPARAWTDIRYISSRKRVVTCEKTTTTTKYSSYIYVCSEGAEELGWQRNQTYRRCIQPPSTYTRQECGTRNPSILHPSRLLLHLHLFPPGLGAAWKNLRTDHLTHPNTQASLPCKSIADFGESVTVRRYKGGPGRSPGQARAGNITALLSHANTSEQAPAWPGVVAAALGRRRSSTPRIISSEGAKRVAQARGTQDASWGS